MSKNIRKHKQLFDYFLVLDFEATCWNKDKVLATSNNGKKTRKRQEIIEFPCIAINAKTLKVDSEFHHYVKPSNEPILSAFANELTGIQQKWVDEGQSLKETMILFQNWLESLNISMQENYNTTQRKKAMIVTCGHWDLQTQVLLLS
eukprot:Pgem_evm1s19810